MSAARLRRLLLNFSRSLCGNVRVVLLYLALPSLEAGTAAAALLLRLPGYADGKKQEQEELLQGCACCYCAYLDLPSLEDASRREAPTRR